MNVLQADGLAFAYRGAEPVLRGFDLRVEPGSMVAVVGPSGSGKSTLLYLLGLMVRPTAGRVLVDGSRADDLGDRARAHLRAQHLGFVFQDAALDATRTVMDNVLEGTLYRRVARSAERARAVELLDRFGVAARSGGRPGQISGGQAQRIALCRALLARPRVLLADEPTGNLDGASAQVVVTAMREHADDGGAVVVVTHDDRLAERCDQQVRL